MTGRDSAETSGYRLSYRALARSAGMQKSRANSSRASTTMASTAPAARARSLHDVPVLGGLADVDGERR